MCLGIKKASQTGGRKAPTGFEPVHKGFADLSLTAWVRRRANEKIAKSERYVQ